MDRETDLGSKRNQQYIRHVEDPKAGKELPPWRMQTGKGNKKKKGKEKGGKRQTRSQADIVWGGPTTGG